MLCRTSKYLSPTNALMEFSSLKLTKMSPFVMKELRFQTLSCDFTKHL